MADVNANIGVSIDTSDALNQLKNLQKQISQFHQSVAKSSAQAAASQRDLQKNFVNSINSIQGFSAELKTVRTTAESFTNSLEKNKFSIREYFRYAGSQTKTFGKTFRSEFDTIEKAAIERVKTLQTQYIKMGRDASGAMQAIAIRPTVLNMQDLGTKTAIAAQKQVLFNQLVKQGSTNLLNFGKNTQWAGRQLMVGFTLPLATLGMTAGRVFMDMEKAAIKFKKVYGDLFTAPAETQKAMDAITELGIAYTKYGVAVADSLDIAADAAAAGFEGVDLQRQTQATLKLSVLGQLELNKALETTIALQNAFRISSEDLGSTIDFLNAVENQTVVALDDITTAIPRVAPVIQSLGGDVKDLAFFLAAMKEGGVNAAQGANALKSGLASLINPSEKSAAFLGQLGVNIKGIVSQNKGDLRGTVIGFAQALDKLDPARRAQAIEQLFGKFQFARISALFDNVIKDGSQASRVLDLAGSSLNDLAALSESELGVSAASSMNKFKASIEEVKVALAPLGELFLDIATPFIEFATTVLKAFNSLPDGIKKTIGTVITVIGGIGPILLMTFGLINNGIANMIKFFATVRLGYLKMTGQAKGIGDETHYMTQEQLEAAAAAASLDQAHSNLTQRFTAEKVAVDALRDAYEQAAAAGMRMAINYPGMMKPGFVANPTKMAKGGVVTVGGRGNRDTEPALLTPGEAVIPAPMVKKYAPLIEGMIAGNIPGYAKGVMLGMPKSAKSVSKSREAADQIYEMFLKSSYANTPPTEYGHQISPTSGHSFPIFGLGGVYQKGNKQVFVKPVLDEKAALAEMRSTEISRRAHGLEAPEQRIVVIRDPLDITRTRRFLALESDLDPKFVNNQPMGLFNEEQYFRQLVASLLRVDKDLSGSNVFGNVVADAGPAGVFSRASGLRDYERGLPSMEEQAIINLLGIKGGAKRAFAESTLGLMAGLTPEQYHQRMLGEIQQVLPRLKETIASFKLTDPTEVGIYDDMVRRLEEGLGVDWSKFHAIHSAVKPPKPKASTQALPQNFANGGMVRGPGGPKDDAIPANLSNGEAVIDAATVKKNPAIISALFDKKKIQIPGYAENNQNMVKLPSVTSLEGMFGDKGSAPTNVSHSTGFSPRELLATAKSLTVVNDEMRNLRIRVIELTTSVDNSGKKVNTVTERFMTLGEAAERYGSEDYDALAGGKGFGATGLLEGKVRNQRAYNAAGISGGATNLEEVVQNGNLAATALARIGDDGSELAQELRLLVREGQEARQILDSVNGTQADYNFVIDHATKTLEQAALKDTAYKTIQDARNAAAERTAKIQQAYDRVLEEGGTAEEALIAAKLELKKQTFEASKFIKDEALTIGVGPKGTGGGRLRDLMTTRGIRSEDGAVEYANSDPNFIGPANKVKITSGRDNRTISAMIARDEAEQSQIKAAEQRALGNLEAVGTTVDQAAAKLVTGFLDRIVEAFKKAAGIQSPSTEAISATQSFVDGVTETLVSSKDDVAKATDQMVQPVTQAIKNASGSSFGNINTKEPVPAVGNAPREIVSAMTQETAAARTFAGDIKAAFANARTNIATEASWIKEELQSTIEKIKQKFGTGGQELVAVAEQTNQGLLIGGKQFGFNYIAQAQGRDGALEAILTKKNAEIISNVTAQYNLGVREIPKVITNGILSQESYLRLSGEKIADIVASSMIKRTNELSGNIPSYATEAPGLSDTPIGPQNQEDPPAKKLAAGFEDLSRTVSTFSIAIASVSGLMSMFGGEFAALSSTVSLVTSGIFALTQVVRSIIQLELIQKIMKKKEILLSAIHAAVLAAASGGLGIFATVTSVATAALAALFAPATLIAIAIAAAAAALIGIGFIIKKQMDRLNAFGNIVNATADQIKYLGEKAGEAVTTTTGFDTATASAQSEVNTEAAKQRAEDEQFQQEFSVQIQAAKDGAKSSVEDALAFLAYQLSSSGLSDKVVQETIAGIVRASGRSDIELDFSKMTVSEENTQGLIDDLKNKAGAIGFIDFDLSGGKEVGKGAASLLKGFSFQLESGKIELDEYNLKVDELRNSINSISNMDSRGAAINAAVDELISDENLKEQIKSVKDLEKRFLLLRAVGGGLTEGLDEMLTMANNASVSTDDFSKSIEINTAAQRKNNKVAKEKEDFDAITSAAVTNLQDETEAINNKIRAYEILTEAGYSTEEALSLLNDEILIGQLVLEGSVNSASNAISDLLEARKKLEAITSSSSGGGGQKSPFQEAIDKLKEQRQEIKNSVTAYAGLRSMGLSVSESFKIAGDSIFAAALASQKVGSQKWNQLLTAIRAARAEEEAWLSTTPEGRAQQFSEVYSKVMDVFNAQEAVLKANNESATAVNKKLIKSLEKQIEAYTRRADELQRDLDKIAEKEDEINKAYDEKTKALEKVKKLNQDIINQQKSQLSIADALSRGDVSAAAEAMQDARAQNAAAQGDATGNALDAARQAQLDALTENGKTRKQIEDEIKRIKKDIADIEFGALQAARDAVEAAEEALEAAVENVRVQGQSRTEWENINTNIEASKANAALYENEVLKALESAKGLVQEWSKLQDTFTTTHVVNTVEVGSGASNTLSGPVSDTNAYGPVGKPGNYPGDSRIVNGTRYDWNGYAWNQAPTATRSSSGGSSRVAVATGGYISGPGTPTSDSIPAMLSDGEYVIKASSVNKFGTQFLDSVNSGQLPKFRLGGMVMDGGRSSSSPTSSFGGIGRRGFYPGEIVNKGGVNYSWNMSTNSWSAVKSSASAASAKPAVSSVAANPATPFQNFEAGFQSVMASVAENPIVQSIGNFVMGSAPVRSLLAVASTPVEIVGAYAKNLVDTIGSVKAKAKQKDFLGIASSVISHALSAVPKSIGQGTLNAFSGVIDPSKMQPTMFEKAAQSAISNDFFGARTNPEMASLARIIGGTLNLAADPLMYLGIGAIAKGAKATVAARTPTNNIIKREIELPTNAYGDTGYANAFQIGKGKPVLFEGQNQNFSSVSSQARIVKTTPEGLLQEALRGRWFPTPNNIRLQSLLNNFKNNKIGKKEDLFLQNMAGAVQGGTEGLALQIQALRGNRAAQQIIEARRAQLVQDVIRNKINQFDSFKRQGTLPAVTNEVMDPRNIAALHSTSFPIVRDKSGNIILRPHGHYKQLDPEADKVARSTLHWTLENPVEEAFSSGISVGSWAPTNQTIVSSLDSVIKQNKLPYSINPTDTFFTQRPGQAMRVRGTVITPLKQAAYEAELIRRGLIKKGQPIPPIAVDNAREEVLHLIAANADEAKKIQEMAMSAARAQQGLPAKPIHRNEELRALAENWGNKFKIPLRQHDTSNPGILEGVGGIYGDIGNLDDSLSAFLYAIRKGKLETFEDFFRGPGLAKGGLVKPSYFAKGGMVPKYFANGGMIKLPKREAPPPQMSKGGMVPKYFASGGMVPKYFSNGGFAKGTDTVPSMLTPGEFVMNRGAVETYGPLLNALNSGINLPMPTEFNKPVYNMPERNYADLGGAAGIYSSSNTASSLTANDNSVYNYSLSVNVDGTNASANDIANVVMNKIKNIQSQQVRRQGVR